MLLIFILRAVARGARRLTVYGILSLLLHTPLKLLAAAGPLLGHYILAFPPFIAEEKAMAFLDWLAP